jgi:hypothetical protein
MDPTLSTWVAMMGDNFQAKDMELYLNEKLHICTFLEENAAKDEKKVGF